MNYNTSSYPASLIGTLVFPGRQSVLPAWTVPEYAAVAYPVLNYSTAAHQMVSALGDDHLSKYLNFANFNTNPTQNHYLNIPGFNNPTTGTTTTSTSSTNSGNSTSSSNSNNNLSLFDPLAISDLYGNAIPYNNAVVQQGLFGNIYGLTSILSRYVGDTMSTGKDSPGYTWKYTLPQTTTSTTAKTSTTTPAATTTSTTAKTSKTSPNTDLSRFDPKAISDLYGNAIPYNNAVVQEGLFGNVHGVTSILSRYVGDLMPTDKDSPGYTWKYTLPNF